ncbi:MAG: glycosyltransferase family 2 protein [SAR324 cluster bacterium]|uniref:Glycosyltransferase family 2 protein n=1 Tax=SAR324 cluster bacterium TaxID=2024889 RepID=A0A7X9IK94_9DELT|nr:glycosyltransferase family 2 protein [SAR324 cluster bacterium]
MDAQQIPGLERRSEAPKSISVVVPCYNEEEVLDELLKRLKGVLEVISIPYEIILVDDGSRDRTWDLMQAHQSNDRNVKIIRLSRNYGHQIALTCGLDQAKGEVILIIDADLQDPPELLGDMLKKWSEGYDVVYGQRTRRQGESFMKRLLAFGFYRIISTITKTNIPRDTGDFRLLDRRALDALLSLREKHRFVRGMVSWIGFHQTPILYERPERFAGETKYPVRKSLVLAFDAITSFSYAPLHLASYMGAGVSIFAFAYIVLVIILKFMDINLPGYTSMMASILLLGGIQLMVLGIMGEYIGRIFEQGQKRPLYFIEKIKGEPLSEMKVEDKA